MERLAMPLLGGMAGMLVACNVLAMEKYSPDDRVRDRPRSQEVQDKVESLRKWLCIADSATGFSYEKGQWLPRKFNVENEKWILEKRIDARKNNKSKYFLKKYGKKFIWSSCKKGNHNWITCKKVNDFLMNTKTKRYIMTYKGSYAYGRDEIGDTPFIEIGKCSPF